VKEETAYVYINVKDPHGGVRSVRVTNGEYFTIENGYLTREKSLPKTVNSVIIFQRYSAYPDTRLTAVRTGEDHWIVAGQAGYATDAELIALIRRQGNNWREVDAVI
jgi:hypothetical protein